MVYMRSDKPKVLNLAFLETCYGDQLISSARNAGVMKQILEVVWICRQGPPKKCSADSEYCRPMLKKLLEAHKTVLSDQPSRS